MTHETSGILVVDKPQNMTSARVVSRIKKISGISKAGAANAAPADPFMDVRTVTRTAIHVQWSASGAFV